MNTVHCSALVTLPANHPNALRTYLYGLLPADVVEESRLRRAPITVHEIRVTVAPRAPLAPPATATHSVPPFRITPATPYSEIGQAESVEAPPHIPSASATWEAAKETGWQIPPGASGLLHVVCPVSTGAVAYADTYTLGWTVRFSFGEGVMDGWEESGSEAWVREVLQAIDDPTLSASHRSQALPFYRRQSAVGGNRYWIGAALVDGQTVTLAAGGDVRHPHTAPIYPTRPAATAAMAPRITRGLPPGIVVRFPERGMQVSATEFPPWALEQWEDSLVTAEGDRPTTPPVLSAEGLTFPTTYPILLPRTIRWYWRCGVALNAGWMWRLHASTPTFLPVPRSYLQWSYGGGAWPSGLSQVDVLTTGTSQWIPPMHWADSDPTVTDFPVVVPVSRGLAPAQPTDEIPPNSYFQLQVVALDPCYRIVAGQAALNIAVIHKFE